MDHGAARDLGARPCGPGEQDNDGDGDCQRDCTRVRCGANARCDDGDGVATCACEPGFEDPDGDGDCAAGCDLAACAANERCVDEPGGVHCVCEEGMYDLDGLPGCEYACAGRPGSVDVPDGAFEDANCDGIDGDLGAALFVSVGGSDAAPGTRESPMRSLPAALRAAERAGKDVYLAAGTYESETLTLAEGVGIYGGFDPADWSRPAASETVLAVFGRPAAGRVVGIEGRDLIVETVVEGLRLEVAHARGEGTTSYGLWCADCGGLVLRDVSVLGGDGAPGSDGVPGAYGAGAGAGEAGTRSGTCDQNGPGGRGGAGGASACARPGGAGGRGGGVMSGSEDGAAGEHGLPPGQPGTFGDGGAGSDRIVRRLVGLISCSMPSHSAPASPVEPGRTGTSGADARVEGCGLRNGYWEPGALFGARAGAD
ncbi:MAG: DUF1565 domain-containing protein, partial [Myxococcota bacterium]